MRTRSDDLAHRSMESAGMAFNQAQRRVGLVDQVYEQTCEAIMFGRYAPGSRVNIRQLAVAIHVSATPVREALSRLISEGVLELHARAITVPRISIAQADEIFDARALLEGELAQVAATRISPSQLALISDLQRQLISALDSADYKEALRCNARFHFAIYRAADKPLMLQMVRGLWLRIGPTLHLNYPELASTRAGGKRHNAVIDSILARDAVGVRAGIVADLRGSQDAIHRLMQAQAATSAADDALAEVA